MNAFMKKLPVAAALALTLAAAFFLPNVISAFKDRSILNKANFDKIIDTGDYTRKQLSPLEKIKLVNSFGLRGKTIMMAERKTADNTRISKDQILGVVQSEIKKLQGLALMPAADMDSAPEFFDYLIQTYVDLSQTATYAIIWKITLVSGGMTFELTLDDETNTIFSYNIYSETDMPGIDYKFLNDKWLTYLGIEADNARRPTILSPSLGSIVYFTSGNDTVISQSDIYKTPSGLTLTNNFYVQTYPIADIAK